MPDQDGDKSQAPTQHRRQQAREEGNVAKSQDLGSAVLLLAAILTLMTAGQSLVGFIARYTERQLGGAAWVSTDINFITGEWNATMNQLGRYVLPILGACLVTAILVNVVQVGFLFLPKKLSMDLSRLDPIQGCKRLFSLTGVARLGFGLFKIIVIVSVALASLYSQRETILGLTALALPEIGIFLIEILLWTSFKIGLALLVLAILEYAFQRWKHEQDLQMTNQEVREEMKNLEGDPQIVSRRRAVQRQLALNRMGSAIPQADVVITNPTELAVAIQYDPETMAAPIVVAKGSGHVAERIRRLAIQHKIPIIEKKPLAQALFREVEVNSPVPRDRYAAVAEVLAYVYQLKGKKIPEPTKTAA